MDVSRVRYFSSVWLDRYNTGAVWLSSARVVRCWVKSRNERNPTLVAIIQLGTLGELPVISRRKVGTTSSHHGPYGLELHTCYNGDDKRAGDSEQKRKTVSVRIALCNSGMKSESLVIADQHAAVNTFPGLVHTARHTMGVGFTSKLVRNCKEAAIYGRVSDRGEVVTR